MTTITEALASFSAGTRFDDLGADVIEDAKRGILDLLGVALAGTAEESTAILREAIAAPSSQGTAELWGSDAMATAPVAALINAYAAHTLNYDDTQHRVETTHMSSAVLPAAFAAAATTPRSGKDLLTAYVVGFEVGCRLARAARFATHLSKRNVNPTGYLGHFGAAASAGNLMRLGEPGIRRAFGIVAGQAAGLMVSSGTMSKGLNAGYAAHNGVLSAILSARGFDGPQHIFDGKQSIFTAFAAQTDSQQLLDKLGTEFEISFNTFKVYACAGWRNSVVAACIALVTENMLDISSVSRIDIYASPDQMRLPNYSDPRSGLESKFSAEHTAAVALIDRAGGIQQFTDARSQDAQVSALRRKATLQADPILAPFQIRVKISGTDGRELSHFVPVPKGDHLNPLTWEELATKFRANAGLTLSQRSVAQALDIVRNLEQVAEVRELANICCVRSS